MRRVHAGGTIGRVAVCHAAAAPASSISRPHLATRVDRLTRFRGLSGGQRGTNWKERGRDPGRDRFEVAPFLYTRGEPRMVPCAPPSVVSVLETRALFRVLLNIAAERLDVLPETGSGVTPRQAEQDEHPQDHGAPQTERSPTIDPCKDSHGFPSLLC